MTTTPTLEQRMDGREKSIKRRCATLKNLSGLDVVTVLTTPAKSADCYEFRCGNKAVTAIYTYQKALAFAKGVQYGRSNPPKRLVPMNHYGTLQ